MYPPPSYPNPSLKIGPTAVVDVHCVVGGSKIQKYSLGWHFQKCLAITSNRQCNLIRPGFERRPKVPCTTAHALVQVSNLTVSVVSGRLERVKNCFCLFENYHFLNLENWKIPKIFYISQNYTAQKRTETTHIIKKNACLLPLAIYYVHTSSHRSHLSRSQPLRTYERHTSCRRPPVRACVRVV